MLTGCNAAPSRNARQSMSLKPNASGSSQPGIRIGEKSRAERLTDANIGELKLRGIGIPKLAKHEQQ